MRGNDCIALLSERSHSVFSERSEQPDPISLPSGRTHEDEGVVNQSDGKLELDTPILLHSLSLSLFRAPFYSSSRFFTRLSRALLPDVHFCPTRLMIAPIQITIHRSR